MPDLVGFLFNWNAGDFLFACLVKQAQFDAGGVRGKESEIDPFSIPGGAQGVGLARPGLK